LHYICINEQINKQMLTKTAEGKQNTKDTSVAAKTASLQPIVFVTIDPALEAVGLNAPLSAKAQAAKKMFAAAKR
jgi:hypothetical protein